MSGRAYIRAVFSFKQNIHCKCLGKDIDISGAVIHKNFFDTLYVLR